MRMLMRIALGTALAAVWGVYGADAATIAGTVAGPDGKGFRGAFVQARNLKTKITVSVLSDNAGKYRIENLPAGDYRLQLRAIGYKADPKTGITLSADQNLAQDLALQQGMVRWSDISMHQGKKLLPEAEGKEELFTHCMACHGFESRMAAVVRDEDGWRDRVAFMRDAMGYFIGRPVFGFNDEKAEKVVSYVNQLFGENSTLPKSPADLPQYQSEVRPFSDEALKIVYVEYDTPGPNRMPWSAHPTRTAPSGFRIMAAPTRSAISIRFPARLRNIRCRTWARRRFTPRCRIPTAALADRTGLRQARPLGPGDERDHRISRHGRQAHGPGRSEDRHGVVHRCAVGIRSQDREIHPHSGSADQLRHRARPGGQRLVHRTDASGKVGKVDAKTLKVTKYTLPTQNGRPRRIEVDDKGIVWFAEFDGGKIGRLDPKTGSITEFQLPGPQPTPYALGIDRDGMVWYSSEYMDVVGRLDPNTGKVIEYPFPHAENALRDFFMDDQGRMWFGSPPNDKVGYFYLAKDAAK